MANNFQGGCQVDFSRLYPYKFDELYNSETLSLYYMLIDSIAFTPVSQPNVKKYLLTSNQISTQDMEETVHNAVLEDSAVNQCGDYVTDNWMGCDGDLSYFGLSLPGNPSQTSVFQTLLLTDDFVSNFVMPSYADV